MTTNPVRGEVWRIRFDPAEGEEINGNLRGPRSKLRPVPGVRGTVLPATTSRMVFLENAGGRQRGPEQGGSPTAKAIMKKIAGPAILDREDPLSWELGNVAMLLGKW